jgi:hypothetical protein
MESETGTREGLIRSETQKEMFFLEIKNCIVLFFKCSGSHRVSFVLYNFFILCFFSLIIIYCAIYVVLYHMI